MMDLKAVQSNVAKVIKIAIGTTLSIIVANWLGLLYATSAGIITLLSIQDTKKDTIKVALKRLTAFVLMSLLSIVLFGTLGYGVWVFGIFLLLFVTLTYLLQITDGIAMNSVLCTHFLASQRIDMQMIGNEVTLFLIGAIVGVVINLFMKSQTEQVREDMHRIEEEMKTIFYSMSKELITVPKRKEQERVKIFLPLKQSVNMAIVRAEKNRKNSLLSDTSYYMDYLLMRKQQIGIMRRVYNQISLLNEVPEQAYVVSLFFEHLASTFHEYNNVKELRKELEYMLKEYKQSELPKTRAEFENRAILYTLIHDMQLFLELKYDFVASLSKGERKRFWHTM